MRVRGTTLFVGPGRLPGTDFTRPQRTRALSASDRAVIRPRWTQDFHGIVMRQRCDDTRRRAHTQPRRDFRARARRDQGRPLTQERHYVVITIWSHLLSRAGAA